MRLSPPITEWHRWFAWRPVRVNPTKQMVWLEWVERKAHYWKHSPNYAYTEYRLNQQQAPDTAQKDEK